MCGIVAYNGSIAAQEPILHGLERLEYRGYDSAGVAIQKDGKLQVERAKGRLHALVERLSDGPMEGTVGIGHTRWATHGEPNVANAHPQVSNDGNFALVHNGIIENFQTLKNALISEGYSFQSDTDTEVAVNLIQKYYDGNLKEAVARATGDIRGTYAFAALSAHEPDTLVVARMDSPLILGVSEDGVFAASDVAALLDYTKKVIYLEDGDLVTIGAQGYTIENQGEVVEREVVDVPWDATQATKEGYDHFMIKEIHEQPKALRDSLIRKVSGGTVDLSDSSYTREEILAFDRIYMSACGTAFHAAEVGKRALEDALGREVQAEVASELRYYMPFITEKSLVIVISQSGETGDTLAVVKEAQKRGAQVLAVTNVVGSSIDRASDKVIHCDAGPEISVASTKAYSTQLLSLFLLALDFGEKVGRYSPEEVRARVKELSEIPDTIEKMLEKTIPEVDAIAEKISKKDSIFYLGRGLDYLSAKEGALKLKEISYIHANALPSGELKHGTIALIEEGLPVVTIITQSELVEKSISNVKEVKARGAHTIVLTNDEAPEVDSVADDKILIPKTSDLYAPLISVLPQQLLAYKTSVLLGNDVDKPRNLAKSVTVE